MKKQTTTQPRQQSKANQDFRTLARLDAQPKSVHGEGDAFWMQRWLQQAGAWEIVDDDLATTCRSSGAVLAVTALTGERTGESAFLWTVLPPQFCTYICMTMTIDSLWYTKWYFDLCKALRARSNAHKALNAALDSYWNIRDVSASAMWLNRARAGRLVGGATQTW